MTIRTIKKDGTGDFTTLAAAVAACATLGDTIRFGDSGVYTESVDIFGGGTGKAITFDCPGFTPAWDGTGVLQYAAKFFTITGAGAGDIPIFRGITFTNWTGPRVIHGNSKCGSFYDCTFSSNGTSARIFDSVIGNTTNRSVLERCKETSGGQFIGNALIDYVDIRSCLIAPSASTDAISIRGTGAATIYNNTIVVQGAFEALIYSSATVLISNNIFRCHTDNGTVAINNSGGTHSYNLFSGFNNFANGGAAGTGDVIVYTLTTSAVGLQVGETLKRNNGAGATIGTVAAINGTELRITPAASGYYLLAGDTLYGVTTTLTRVVSVLAPIFTNEAGADYTVPSTSPAINAGTTIAAVTNDLLGVARPQGAAYDQGAYETILSATVVDVTVLSATSVRINLSGAQATDATWADVSHYTITSSDGGYIPVISAAAGTGNPSSVITLTTGEHTNGKTYDVAVAGVTNVTNGHAGYTGQGAGPTISAAVPQSATVTRVTFSEAMTNNAALLLAGNYTFSPTGGGGGLTPAASSVAYVDSTHVDVTHSAGLAGKSYDLTIANVQDAALNPTPGSTASYTAPNVTVASAAVQSATVVRLTFSGPVVPSASLTTIGNYTPSKNAPDTGVALVTASVAEQGGGAPTYVDITTNEQTTGQSYRMTVAGVTGITGGFADFTGAGTAPTVSSATPQLATVTRLVFSETMTSNAALTTAGNYVITPQAGGLGLAVASVAVVNGTTVDVTHATGLAGKGYTITVAGPQDVALNACAGSAQNFTTPDVTVASAVATSATNVRVTFSGPVNVTASLTTTGNYTPSKLAPDVGVALTVSAATAQGGGAPTYVDLTVNEQTTGQSYRFTVAGVTGVTGGHADFTGSGVAPTIASAVPQSATVTRVGFSEAMTNNGELTNATNYVFAAVGTPPGGYVPVASSVAVVDGSHVDVTHSLGSAGWPYALTVTGPQDTALNPCSDVETFDAWATSQLANVTVESLTSILVSTNGVQTSADVEGADDWAVTVESGPAAVVAVVSAALTGDDTQIRLTLWPGLTPGATYRTTGAHV